MALASWPRAASSRPSDRLAIAARAGSGMRRRAGGDRLQPAGLRRAGPARSALRCRMTTAAAAPTRRSRDRRRSFVHATAAAARGLRRADRSTARCPRSVSRQSRCICLIAISRGQSERLFSLDACLFQFAAGGSDLTLLKGDPRIDLIVQLVTRRLGRLGEISVRCRDVPRSPIRPSGVARAMRAASRPLRLAGALARPLPSISGLAASRSFAIRKAAP